MGIVNSMKSFMGFDDEEESVMDEIQQEVEFRNPKVDHSTQRKNNGKIVSIQQQISSEVVIMQPYNFDDGHQICDHLKNRKPIVVNIEEMDTSEAQRIIDFLCGSVCALDGKIKKVSNTIFLIVPRDMEISGNVKDEYRSSKVNAYSV